MDPVAKLAEAKIRAAMAEGEFDDLPGYGTPLRYHVLTERRRR